MAKAKLIEIKWQMGQTYTFALCKITEHVITTRTDVLSKNGRQFTNALFSTKKSQYVTKIHGKLNKH